MSSGASDPIFPVGFDDEAFTEDAEGGSAEAGKAFIELRREIIKQGGLPKSRLKACDAEGRDGTNLAGCVKTYVPWPNGRFGMVFVPVAHPNRPLALRAIAFGARHHPRGSHAESVYEVAHRRLHSP